MSLIRPDLIAQNTARRLQARYITSRIVVCDLDHTETGRGGGPEGNPADEGIRATAPTATPIRAGSCSTSGVLMCLLSSISGGSGSLCGECRVPFGHLVRGDRKAQAGPQRPSLRRQHRDRSIFSMRTSGRQIYAGHPGWSGAQSRLMEVTLGLCGCCTLLLHWLTRGTTDRSLVVQVAARPQSRCDRVLALHVSHQPAVVLALERA